METKTEIGAHSWNSRIYSNGKLRGLMYNNNLLYFRKVIKDISRKAIKVEKSKLKKKFLKFLRENKS